jgi:hypothetical protein
MVRHNPVLLKLPLLSCGTVSLAGKRLEPRRPLLVSGHPMLGNATVDVAKKWRFFPGTRIDPVEAVLKFSLCPDK